MRITLLGTGGPRPDPLRHSSSLVVSIGRERLLFDCGRGTVLQLVRGGVRLADVNPVFLTHHHYDHIGDLADVILTTWLEGRAGALRIIGPEGTSGIVTALLKGVYAKDIQFRDIGEPAIGGWKPVEVTEVGGGWIHDAGNWKVSSEYVEHGQGLGIPDFKWITLGYRVEAGGKVLAISGDTIPCEGLERLAQKADVLVQCCYLADVEITNPHTERLTRYLFASASQVGEIAAASQVKTLVLTHFRRKTPELMRQLEEDVRRRFAGQIILGEDLLQVQV